MSQPYILRRDGRDYQAPGLAAMRQWAQDGRVLPSDMVYSPKYQSWYRARDLRELRDVLPNMEPQAPAPAAVAPPAPPPKQFWLRKGDQSYAADSLDAILKWASEGHISPDDFIYHPAYSKWFRAGDSPQLASRFPPHIAHQPPFLPPMDDPLRGPGRSQPRAQPAAARAVARPQAAPKPRSLDPAPDAGSLETADSVAKTVMDFRAADLHRQLRKLASQAPGGTGEVPVAGAGITQPRVSPVQAQANKPAERSPSPAQGSSEWGSVAPGNTGGFGEDVGAGGAAKLRQQPQPTRDRPGAPVQGRATGSGQAVKPAEPRRSARPKPPPPPPGALKSRPNLPALDLKASGGRPKLPDAAKAAEPAAGIAKPAAPQPVAQPVAQPVPQPVVAAAPQPAPVQQPVAAQAPAQPVANASAGAAMTAGGLPSSASLEADETAKYFDRGGLLKLMYDVARCYVVTKDIRPGELLETACELPSTGDSFLGQAKHAIYSKLAQRLSEHLQTQVMGARSAVPDPEKPGFDLFVKRAIELHETFQASLEHVGKKPPERFVIGNSGRPKMTSLEAESMLRIDAAIKALVSVKTKTPIAA